MGVCVKLAKSALALLAVFALAACSTTQAAPGPSPATTSAPSSTEASEATLESSNAASSTVAPPPEVRESTAVDENGTAHEVSDEAAYYACLNDAEEATTNEDYDAQMEACASLLPDAPDVTDAEFDEMMAEEIKGTKLECWLELEKTRPELFESAEPSQYAVDPEVIAECG